VSFWRCPRRSRTPHFEFGEQEPHTKDVGTVVVVLEVVVYGV